MRWKHTKSWSFVLQVGITLIISTWARAQYATVFGSIALPSTTSNPFLLLYPNPVYASSGVAVGRGDMWTIGPNNLETDDGTRWMRWDSSGNAVMLPSLSTTAAGYVDNEVEGINRNGVIAGYSAIYDGNTYDGFRATFWDASGAIHELDTLGTDASGFTKDFARGINDSGQIAGQAMDYQPGGTGEYLPVIWNSSGSISILSLPPNYSSAEAVRISNTGWVFGFGVNTSINNYDGGRTFRWDPTGNVQVLGLLGTGSNNYNENVAKAINDAGTVVGSVHKYVNGIDLGSRAVRWDASSTAAIEMETLGADANGVSNAAAVAINNDGIIAGYAYQYIGGVNAGLRAARWDASGDITALGILGTDSDGNSQSDAFAINADGTIVGFAEKYDSAGNDLGRHAMMWSLDGTATDLNDLIDPASGWTLLQAWSITDDDWISGEGMYDPDGAGPDPAYERLFLLQVPEPSSLALFGLVLTWSLKRPRRSLSI